MTLEEIFATTIFSVKLMHDCIMFQFLLGEYYFNESVCILLTSSANSTSNHTRDSDPFDCCIPSNRYIEVFQSSMSEAFRQQGGGPQGGPPGPWGGPGGPMRAGGRGYGMMGPGGRGGGMGMGRPGPYDRMGGGGGGPGPLMGRGFGAGGPAGRGGRGE